MTDRRLHRASLTALVASMLLVTACVTAPVADLSRSANSPVTGQTTPAVVPAATPIDAPDALAAPADGESAPSVAIVPRAAPEPAMKEFQRGRASWYGPGFHGRRTANGERFDMHTMTAAHRTLPFGTRVRVRSLVTGKEIDVRVNDRGPYSGGRIIDLSRAAGEALGLLTLGVKDVMLLVSEDLAPVARLDAASILKRPRTAPVDYDALRN
jgi:rare lipoprotein A